MSRVSKQTSTSVTAESTIGETLHRLRVERGLSLRTLASKTGFSPSFLSQVENGQASPSISSLERLLQPLGLRLVDFFEEASAESGTVMRSSARKSFTSEWSRASFASVVPRGALRSLEGLIITLSPSGRSGKPTSTNPSEQLALVLEGSIALIMSGKQFNLTGGDAAAIPAGCPHGWENLSEADARIAIITASPPASVAVKDDSVQPPAPRRATGRGKDR